MVSVLLGILKIIGILFLIVLAIVILLLTVILFCAIKYYFEAEKYEEIKALGSIKAFWGILRAEFIYEGGILKSNAKVFNKVLYSSENEMYNEDIDEDIDEEFVAQQPAFSAKPMEGNEDKPKTSQTLQSAMKPQGKQIAEKPTGGENKGIKKESRENTGGENQGIKKEPNENTGDENKGIKKEFSENTVGANQGIKKEPNENTGSENQGIKKEPNVRRIKMAEIQEEPEEQQKNKDTKKEKEAEKIDVDYFADMPFEEKKKVLSHIFKLLERVLKHILPRECNLKIIVGAGDPALTGQILGAIGILSGITGLETEAYGNFEELELSGEIKLKGRIRPISFVSAVLKFGLSKEIFKIIRIYLKGNR